MRKVHARRTRRPWLVLLVIAMVLPFAAPAAAHDDSIQSDGGALAGAADVYVRHALSGHETAEPSESGPPAVAEGFEHVSTLTFDFDGDGVLDTGIGSVTDVWEHGGFAYVGTFYEPDCSRFGTRIVDVRDPENPTYVGNIQSMPNTRVNDVKVAEVDSEWFSGDVLAMTQEPCFLTRGNGTSRHSKGGVVLYDVSDPANPEILSKAYIAGPTSSATNFGVHNTYFFEADGREYLGLVDDDNVRDFRILDITKPNNPVEVAAVGWPDWFGEGGPAEGEDPQGANGLGSFAATFIHDIWVEEHDGKLIGYLSYWDAGLILLDLSDPANPVFMGHSDYDEDGPEGQATGEEGNSHVAVPAPADDGRYVLMGDEDFSPDRASALVSIDGGEPDTVKAAEGAFTTPYASFEEPATNVVSAGGELCSGNGVDFDGGIALIARGTCAFQTKADIAAAQGATGMIVYNDAARGDALVLMGGTATELFGFFVGNSDGMALESALAGGSKVEFVVETQFDGWGYLRVIDTRSGGDTFEEVASFATPNTFRNPVLPGDYTMHNIVMGPAGTDWSDTAFISWYSDGMIALDASDPTNLDWTGQWIGCYAPDGQGGPAAEDQAPCDGTLDTNGNVQAAATNFWGVYPTVIDDEVYILGSDRNNGLVILRPVAGSSIAGGLAPGGGSTP